MLRSPKVLSLKDTHEEYNVRQKLHPDLAKRLGKDTLPAMNFQEKLEYHRLKMQKSDRRFTPAGPESTPGMEAQEEGQLLDYDLGSLLQRREHIQNKMGQSLSKGAKQKALELLL